MNITTIAGILIALTGLLGGMYFKNVPFLVLLNPASVFIILVGTSGAISNAFQKSDVKNIPKLFALIFTDKKQIDNLKIIEQFVEFSMSIRKDGILSIETTVNNLEDKFMRDGLNMLLTGQKREFIEEVLDNGIEKMEERHRVNASIFTQAGTYAPTLGVLGAVIGLIAALGNMGDTEKLGHAISAAFVATLYGIFTGYVLWLPFANKLKRKSSIEIESKRLIQQGIFLLEQGASPNIIEETLLAYLPQWESEKYAKEKGDTK